MYLLIESGLIQPENYRLKLDPFYGRKSSSLVDFLFALGSKVVSAYVFGEVIL